MEPLPFTATDADLITFADEWPILMEAEEYAAAFGFTEHIPAMGWTPVLIRAVVKAYGDARESQKVTLLGESTDIKQRKTVTRYNPAADQSVGEIWYDLNIDGHASDLTATFDLKATPGGIIVFVNDIHVM